MLINNDKNMESLSINFTDYVKSLFVKEDKIEISKTEAHWDSLTKFQQIDQLRYMIRVDLKNLCIFSILRDVFKFMKLSSPVLMFLFFFGLNMTFVTILTIVSFVILHLIEMKFKVKTTLSHIGYQSTVVTLENELQQYGK